MRWIAALLPMALLGAGACAGILGLGERHDQHAFEHREHAEAGVHCLTCHTGVNGAGDTGDLHLPSTETCVHCHKTPHDNRDCNGCHGLSFTRGVAARAKETLRFDHAKHLDATGADCVRCHADAGSGAARMLPRMADCLGCHGHEKQFDVKDCGACHVDMKGEGTAPEDHFVHGGDFVNEHAAAAQRADGMCDTCHAERFCAGCHAGGKMPATFDRLHFDDPRTSTLHDNGFLARHAEASRDSPGLCTTCHAPESCESCHTRDGVGATKAPASGSAALADVARSPHPPGWVGPPGTSNEHGEATFRDPASCEGCHGGAGQVLCVRCHAVGGPGGNPHFQRIAPSGDKNQQPCALCHRGGR